MMNETQQDRFLVSLIVPIFNAEIYLPKCLDSILNQTYRNLEVILIDDGSTDNSLAICHSYAKIDSRFVVVHQANVGVYAARNKGLSLCHGTFLGFVDADDWVHPDYVMALVAEIGNDDMIVCGFYVVESDTVIIEKHVSEIMSCTSMEYLEKTVDDELCVFNGSQPYPVLGGYLWNKLFRREVWRDLFFEEGIHFADMTAVMAYLGRTHGVRLIPSCHYYYLQREGSITHCRLNKHSADFVEMRKKQKAFIIQQGADQSLISRSDMLILLAYIHLIRTCLMAGTKKSNIFDIYLQDFQYILRCNIYCLRYIGSFKILVKIFLLYFCPACYVYIWRLKNGLDLLRI